MIQIDLLTFKRMPPIGRKLIAEVITDGDVLDAISTDPNMDVLAAIALNPYVQPLTLEKMLRRGTAWFVRRNIINNANTPKYIIKALQKDPDQRVAEYARKRLGKCDFSN